MIKRIYISTLAFNKWNLINISNTIKKHKISGIDLAPLTLFKTWKNFEKNLIFFKKKILLHKIKINSIQGIFFKKKYNLFLSTPKKISDIRAHLNKIIKISKLLGINKIIIGSSNFRDKKNLSRSKADKKFIKFFSTFKKTLKKNKIFFCLEVIPEEYNESYIFSLSHMVDIINKINSANIKINFDTSLFHFNKFDFNQFYKNKDKIKNIQISQKNFKNFKRISKNNKKFLKKLKKIKSHNSISLEMILKSSKQTEIDDSIMKIKEYLN
jgi:sugar phosphate isomerase/epimerase